MKTWDCDHAVKQHKCNKQRIKGGCNQMQVGMVPAISAMGVQGQKRNLCRGQKEWRGFVKGLHLEGWVGLGWENRGGLHE